MSATQTYTVPDYGTSDIKSILVLRSATVDVVEKTLSEIHRAWPNASVSLLCQPQFIGHFEAHAEIKSILAYEANTFAVQDITPEQLASLQAHEFDMVIPVYSNESGNGYGNVNEFASALRPRYLCPYNSAGEWFYATNKLHQASEAERRNTSRIVALKDIHLGKRAFILGMGPSLRVSDLDLLKDEITFACNKIFLAFDETSWRPSYYSVIDLLVAKNNAEKINALNLTKIHDANLQEILHSQNSDIYVRSLKNPGPESSPDIQFSEDPSHGVYGGRTAIYFQIQLAFYMGIRELYLLGLDFNFDVPATTAGKTDNGETILVHSGERNHFHPDYRAPGEHWSVPKLDIQKKAFICARDHFRAHGGTIYNLSRETKLDVFPRAQLEDILG